MSFYGTTQITVVKNETGAAEPITNIIEASKVILHHTGDAVGTATVNGAIIEVKAGAVVTLDQGAGTFTVTSTSIAGMQVIAVS